MKIAVFDSGIGGITVLTEAIRQLPQEDFLYFADTLHVPYGTKPKQEVQGYIYDSISMILQEPIKAIIIACNTATSIAISQLRANSEIPIIGMEPAVKPAVEMSRSIGKRVLVLATPLTLREAKYHELVQRVDDLSIVDSLPLPDLVEFCEALQFDSEIIKTYFNKQFAAFDLSQYGTLVLGCTHFPFYKRILSEILPVHIKLIDGSQGTVRRLKEMLAAQAPQHEAGSGEITFMCSGHNESYTKKMREAFKLYNESINTN
ncbi:glutamate racemase [Paenibacillus eucommiae]|uniref:Glutamate racemase n=1 Tax=Paenibacillus eucommiae TaxID=1355755 RepID=A0ABS4IR67_9BACL|nr:glutamate racemase [Paenibacillus eucommiae]MBP1990066.1 glutamate racemase [Paenibacillus eucommiae]